MTTSTEPDLSAEAVERAIARCKSAGVPRTGSLILRLSTALTEARAENERLAQENEALNRDLALAEKMAMEANDSYSDQHDALVVAEARVAKLEAGRGVGLPTPSKPCADSQSYRATTTPAEAIARAALERAGDECESVADNWSCGHMPPHCDCAGDIEQWRFAADECRALATPATLAEIVAKAQEVGND